MLIEDRVIVVTGAGSGIGRELCLQLNELGAEIAAVDYNGNSLDATRELLTAPERVSLHVVDISDSRQVAALPDVVQQAHGRVHGLINNAGIIQPHSEVTRLPENEARRIFDVNWWGLYSMVQAFVPLLEQSAPSRIVNISSMGGYMPFPGQSIYGASKAAVKLLSEGLQLELKEQGIGVSVVYPGAVQTNIFSNAPGISDAQKAEVMAKAEKESVGVSARRAAQLIIRGMQRDRSRILVGTDSWIIDKLYRMAPVQSARLLAWLMRRYAGDALTDPA